MTSLSTWCRQDASPEDLARRIAALGATGVALDATLDAGYLAALRVQLLLAGLPVVAVEAPCPRGPGKRPPSLTTDDKDERRAAVRLHADTLALAAEVGARAVVTRLGHLATRYVWADTVHAFARRTLTRAAIDRLLAERLLLTPRVLDLARFGLEPVLDRAASAGVTVAVSNVARWFELPDEMELATLLEDFRGAPLAPWYDAAAAHARAATGFGKTELLVKRAAGAWLTDAAGLRGGLPWGRGEVDRAKIGALPDGALKIVHCAVGTEEEIAAGLTGS